MAMRWFDGLRADSINSFKELTQAFGSHFVTCSRVPWPLDSLLSLSMQEGETLKTYSDGSSNDEEDVSYRRRSRTPPSESFSCDEECHHQ